MAELNLKIPRLKQVDNAHALLNMEKIGAWVKNLPIANAQESATKVQELLTKINRVAMKPHLRHEILNVIEPAVREIHGNLSSKHQRATQPLSEKNLAIARITNNLQEEMATGYKLLCQQLSEIETPTQSEHKLLSSALRPAIQHLANIIIESYAIYVAEPAGTWSEIHQIYEYAETHHLLPKPGEEKHADDINAIYKAILLVGLSSPYHLLRGEAFAVYRLMLKWNSGCLLARPDASEEISNEYYVDLSADAPPNFASQEKHLRAADPCIINVEGVVATASEQIQNIMLENKRKHGNTILPLSGRMERDLYMRVKESLTSRSERRFNRDTKLAEIELAASLSTSHHYVSDEANFTPEQDELTIKKGAASASTKESFTIIPKEEEDWHLATNPNVQFNPNDSMRLSQFQATDPGSDIWQNIYSSNIMRIEAMEAQSPKFETSRWYQRDESLGGISLFCDEEIPQYIQVGELISFRIFDANETGQMWSVGVIRWMQNIPGERLEIGIKTLAYSARPIATRALAGAGKGSENFRGLLIPNGDPTTTDTTLIAPAALYDVGTVLLLNMKTGLVYVKLTRMLDTTKSFAHFSFEIDPEGAKYEGESRDSKEEDFLRKTP